MPDIFRIECVPQGDTLGVHLRSLGDHECKWTSTTQTIDVLDSGNPLDPLTFDARIERPEGTLLGAVKLILVGDDDLRAAYVSARATVRPCRPDDS